MCVRKPAPTGNGDAEPSDAGRLGFARKLLERRHRTLIKRGDAGRGRPERHAVRIAEASRREFFAPLLPQSGHVISRRVAGRVGRPTPRPLRPGSSRTAATAARGGALPAGWARERQRCHSPPLGRSPGRAWTDH
jgi:hypothetical protein